MGNYITNKMKFTIIALLGCASAIRLSSKDDGFEVDILAQGEGDKVPDGAEVEMNYTGTLLDGTKFDSSLDHGKTFKSTSVNMRLSHAGIKELPNSPRELKLNSHVHLIWLTA